MRISRHQNNVVRKTFNGYLKKNILGKISDVTKASCMQKEMEMGTFLPKQTVKDNSVIPYQIHLYELNAILKIWKIKFRY